MGYLIMGFRNINRRRMRSAIAAGAIAVIIIAFFTLATIYTVVNIGSRSGGAVVGVGKQIGFPYFADMTIVGQPGFQLNFLEASQPARIPPLITNHAELLTQLDGMEAVTAAAPRLGSFSVTRWEVQRQDGSLTEPHEQTWRPTMTVQGIDPVRERRLRGLGDIILQGRYLRPGDTSSIIVGYDWARYYQVGMGDQMRLQGKDFTGEFTIAGIFLTSTPEDGLRVFITVEAAQQLLDLGNVVSEVAVVAKPGRLQEVAQQITQYTDQEVLFPSLEVVPDIGTVLSLWSTRSAELAHTELLVLLGVLGWLFVFQAMLTNVFDRTREIGIMKAIGWAREDVLRSTIVEAALLGALGGSVGYALGIAAPALLNVLGLGPIVLLEPSLVEAAGSVGLAILICLVAALIPADMASEVPPLEAMGRA